MRRSRIAAIFDALDWGLDSPQGSEQANVRAVCVVGVATHRFSLVFLAMHESLRMN
jgi:hypothetical protein